ncbi:MAG: ABC transporter permease [Candidatus Tectomicrobia bacterium]|nr:ABC transporter permease [Candidatus Tectomicrobia bacterium]
MRGARGGAAPSHPPYPITRSHATTTLTNASETALLPSELAANGQPTFVIQPTRGWRFLDLREIWAYRELVYFLTWRDIKVRYKQTAIGVAWAVIQPLAMMIVFTLFFGRLAKIPSEGVPYPIFAYVALLPWQLFSRTLSETTNSLVTDQRLITRVYFPRIIVPLSATLAALVDFLVSSALLVVLMIIYGIAPGAAVLLLPAFVLLMLVTSLGVGFWLSALNLEYRDVAYVVPFLTQFWLFLTPVVYPSSMIPDYWRPLFGLNPMTGVVEGFRWALLGIGDGPSPMLLISAAFSVCLFLSGIIWFRYRERTFVDAVGSGGR